MKVATALTEIVDVLEEPDHRHCSLMVRMKRSATPLPWGSPTKAASSSMPEPVERALEVVGPVLAAPVVAELDPPGHVGPERPEAVDDGVIDRLEGGEAVAHLGHVGPGLVGVVVEEDEDPDPAVVPGPGHGGVGAPADVRGIGDDPCRRGPGASALGRPLGGEQAGVAHEAQHPVLAHVELVLPPQVGPDLAVALAGEGASR